MNRIISNRYLLLGLRVILGAIFIFSGIEKIAAPIEFAQSIINYKLIPDFLINFMALTLPWVELIAGILLILGISVRENAFILSVLLVVFIAAVGISIARGLNIDCGCFGTAGGTKVGFSKIGENMLLLSAGLVLIFKSSDFMSLRH